MVSRSSQQVVRAVKPRAGALSSSNRPSSYRKKENREEEDGAEWPKFQKEEQDQREEKEKKRMGKQKMGWGQRQTAVEAAENLLQ